MGIIVIALSILAPFASANVLDGTDYSRVSSLIRKSLQLQEDIINVADGTKNNDARDRVLELHECAKGPIRIERAGNSRVAIYRHD